MMKKVVALRGGVVVQYATFKAKKVYEPHIQVYVVLLLRVFRPERSHAFLNGSMNRITDKAAPLQVKRARPFLFECRRRKDNLEKGRST